MNNSDKTDAPKREIGVFAPIFLKLPPENIVAVKFILESYEGIGIVRTLNPDTAEIVVLALEDTHDVAQEILASIKEEYSVQELPRPEKADGDWLLEALW